MNVFIPQNIFNAFTNNQTLNESIDLNQEKSISQELKKTYNSACQALKQNKLEEAFSQFIEILSKQPNHTMAWLQVGKCLVKDENYEQAEKVYLTLLSKNPLFPEALSEYARIAQKQQNWDSALEQWNKLLDLNPKHKQALNNKAQCLINLNILQEAESTCLNLINHYPQFKPAHQKYAQIAQKQQNWKLALERWNDLLTKYPDHLPAYKSQVTILQQLGLYKKAEETCISISKKFPESSDGQKLLINLNIHRRHWGQALKHSNELLKSNPKDLTTLIHKASILVNSKKEQGYEIFKKLEKRYPQELAIYTTHISLLLSHFRYQEALELTEAALKNSPQTFSLIKLKVNCLLQLNRLEEASELINNLKGTVTEKDLADLKIRLLQFTKNYPESLKLANTLHQQNPTSQSLNRLIQNQLHYATVYSDNKILQEAIHALETSTPNPQVLAKAYIQNKNNEKALKTIKKLPKNHAKHTLELLMWKAYQENNISEAKRLWQISLKKNFYPALHTTINQLNYLQKATQEHKGLHKIKLFACIKNAETLLPWFLDYYRNLGISSFYIIDNDSDDNTITYLKQQKDINVFWTNDHYGQAHSGMRWINQLIETHGQESWNLFVDIDEALIFPNSETLSLSSLISYLEQNNYEALPAFMLDMYPENTSSPTYKQGSDPIQHSPYFDNNYTTQGFVQSPYYHITGGIRQHLFEHSSQFTKVPLSKGGRGISYTMSHTISPAILADINAVLLHYKFTEDLKTTSHNVQTKETRSATCTQRYKHYEETLKQLGENFSLKNKDSYQYKNSNQLIELNLLKTSDQFNLFLGTQQKPKTKQQLLQECNDLITQNAFQEADELCSNLIQENPDFKAAYQKYAQLAQKQQNWKLALERWDNLLTKLPNHLPALKNKANILTQLYQYDEAEILYKQIIKDFPDKPDVLQGLAQLAQKQQQWQLALERWDQVITKFPDHLPALKGKANTLTQLYKYSEAETLYQQIIKEFPDKPDVLQGLAQLAQKQRNWNLALERWNDLLIKFPEFLASYQGKVHSYIKLQEYQLAEVAFNEIQPHHMTDIKYIQLFRHILPHIELWDRFEQSIELYIKENNSLLNIIDYESPIKSILVGCIDLLILLGKPEHATKVIASLEKYKSFKYELQLLHAQIHKFDGNTSEAKQVYENLLIRNPKNYQETYFRLIQLHYQEAQYNEVIQLHKKIIFANLSQLKAKEKNFFLKSSELAAGAYLALHKLLELKILLAQLIKCFSQDTFAYELLFDILCFHDKKYKSALNLCKFAFKKNINVAQSYINFAIAKEKIGDCDKAITIIEDYLNKNPKDKQAAIIKAYFLRKNHKYQDALKQLNTVYEAEGLMPLLSLHPNYQFSIPYLTTPKTKKFVSDQKISVIMTTYKANDFIPYAIQSVLAQTYTNLELIIVDDASPDHTYEWLKDLARIDERIKLLRLTDNQGTYVAKNEGIAHSTGSYISFIDSDDWIHPQTLEYQVTTLNERNILAMTNAFFRVTRDSEIELMPEYPMRQAHITLCFKREPIMTKIGFFDAVRTGADTEHLRRIISVFGDKNVYRMDVPLLISTRHKDSITGGGDLGFAWYGPAWLDKQYFASYQPWHNKILQGNEDPFLPHPLEMRKFKAPESFLPKQQITSDEIKMTNFFNKEEINDSLKSNEMN